MVVVIFEGVLFFELSILTEEDFFARVVFCEIVQF